MTETVRTLPAQEASSRSAVGCLVMLVEVVGGTEKVTYERRLPDAAAARQWCEDKVRRAPEGTSILEIRVTEEVWGHRHAWEATATRHIPETLQLGRRGDDGRIAWGDVLVVGIEPGPRGL